MKGIYEHNWQEAMAGATIEPSEALWNNIASKLDNERGRNYWVTLLMIAATVSIAFAFPLTLGTLDYNAQPDHSVEIGQATEPTKQITNDKPQISNNTEFTKSKNQIANNTQNLVPKTQNHNTQIRNNDQTIVTKPQVTENQVTNNQNQVSAQRINGLPDLGNTQLAGMENYYLIPYFMPLKKDDISGTNLLASLNMGTGSVSNNSGGGGFEALFAQSEQANDVSGFNKNSENRSESQGTAYYIGAGIEFPLGKRWSLLTGLGYRAQHAEGFSNIVQEVDSRYQPLGAYAPVTTGTAFLSESYDYSVTNNYLSVPLSFKYPFISKKIVFRGGLGISTDVMLSNRINSETYGSASYTPESQEYKRFLLGGVATLDVSYNINNLYSIAFETGYRRGLTSIDQNKEHYPSSFTVGVILFYKIK